MASRDDIMDEVSSGMSENYDHPKPFFTLFKQDEGGQAKINSDKSVLEWAKKAKASAFRQAKLRQRNIEENNALYRGDLRKGNHDGKGGFSHLSEVPEISHTSPDTQYVMVNHLMDLTDTRVARFSRYRDNIEVLPANSAESSDKQSARLVKELIKYLRYTTDFKSQLKNVGKRMIISAEAYMFVEWDPEAGPMLPEVDEALRASGNLPEIPQEGEDGQVENKPISPDQSHMGEIIFRVPLTSNVFLEPVMDGDFSKVDWLIERELLHIEELKMRYPDKANEIREDAISAEDAKMIASANSEDWDGKVPKGYVWCYYLWHRGTKYVPEGRLLVFTNTTLLNNSPHPYNHKKLPCIRITDVDVDGQLYPRSAFSMSRNLNGLLNNMYSMIYRYQVLMGPPRWVYPENANVQREALGNDTVGLKYRGGVPPKIEVAPPMSGELFSFIQQMKEELRQSMVVFPMAQGQVPPNIRAGVSMLFMDEQENERFDVEAKKHNQFVVDVWKLVLEVVRQYYPKDENRKIAIFGNDESYTMQDFDPTILNTQFEIRLQNAPSLPESKAARTQYLLDIDERKPMPNDQFYEYLDMGIPEAYTNEITKAKRAADSENEMLLAKQPLASPQPWEDHIAHLLRHYVILQGKEFKALSPEQQKLFLSHVNMHEFYVMASTFVDFDMSQPVHMGRAQALQEIPQFPAVFKPNITRATLMSQAQDAQMAGQVAMAGGGATMGMEGQQPIAEAGPQQAAPQDNIEQSPMDKAGSEESAAPESSPQ